MATPKRRERKHVIPCVRVFIHDLNELVEIFKRLGGIVYISDSSYEYDSIDDVRATNVREGKPRPRLTALRISTFNTGASEIWSIAVDLSGDKVEVTLDGADEDDDEALLAFDDTISWLHERRSSVAAF